MLLVIFPPSYSKDRGDQVLHHKRADIGPEMSSWEPPLPLHQMTGPLAAPGRPAPFKEHTVPPAPTASTALPGWPAVSHASGCAGKRQPEEDFE